MKTLIIAHRGASQQRPENTIPAFQLALAENADGIEGDFHLTKDGQIVCIHDFNTARVANLNLTVADSTLAQLKKLDVGKWFNLDYQGLKIPTLAEVLAILSPPKKLFMEVKCDLKIIPSLKSIIDFFHVNNSSQLVIISFNLDVLKAVKNIFPHLKTLWLLTITFDCEHQQLSPSSVEILETLKDTKADGCSTSVSRFLDANFIKEIQSQGYEYHLWTVDNVDVAKKFVKIGVNSLTTNVPKILRENIYSNS